MANQDSNDESVINIDVESILMPLALIVSTIIFSFAFVIGMGRVDINSIGSTTNSGNTAAAPSPTPSPSPTAAPQAVEEGVVSVDDDAVIGASLKEGTVVVVEFSDFNCGFCQRHHQETLPSLLSNFEGQNVSFIYRDYPGVGGETTLAAAAAAECAREQVGDDKYMDLIKDVYDAAGTKDVALVNRLAKEISGLNASQYDDCVASDTYRGEVEADRADGMAAGVNGTPGFVVGVMNADGIVEGELVSGAQPLSVFESTINKYLN